MDDLGALVTRLDLEGPPGGALSGRTFVAKDLYDVEGLTTGAGNPSFRADAVPAVAHAPAVARLLGAGARLVATTVTDELAYSLAGANAWYGTPRNPAAPGRLPGGSSSGSAAAVAGGLADIGLGTDTGGSIRVPASYCGLVGVRPTHGRVPLAGVVPLAPRFDTGGWFARDPTTARLAGRVLLDPMAPPAPVRRLLVVTEALDLLDAAARGPFLAAAELLGLPLEHVSLAADLVGSWRPAFQTLQGAQAWAEHGAWITAAAPAFAPDIAGRFRIAAEVTAEQVGAAEPVLAAARARVLELTNGAALVLPSACGVAPVQTIAGQELADLRLRTLSLTCVSGLSGVPAVSLPLAAVDGLPLGVCVLGAPGSEDQLLALGGAAWKMD